MAGRCGWRDIYNVNGGRWVGWPLYTRQGTDIASAITMLTITMLTFSSNLLKLN